MAGKKAIAAVLSLGLFLALGGFLHCEPAGAAGEPSPLAPLGLAVKLQGSLLMAVEKAFAETVLGQAQTRLSFGEGMEAAAGLVKSLRQEVAGRPGMERTGRYLTKLEESSRAVSASGRALLNKWRAGGELDEALAAEMDRHRDQVLYRVGQLVRHIASGLEVARLSPARKQGLVEVMLITALQAKLLKAVNIALADGPGNSQSREVIFWDYLSEFDMNFIALAAVLDPKTADQWTGRLTNLRALKHDVVISGEAVYVTNRAEGQADVKAVRMLDSAVDEAADVLEEMLDLALKR